MKKYPDQSWGDLERYVSEQYPLKEWRAERNERAFLFDLLDTAKRGDLFSVLGILNDDVQTNFGKSNSKPEITFYGRLVLNPGAFASSTQAIKVKIFQIIDQHYITKVKGYINNHPENAESHFLAELLSKVNKDSTRSDYEYVLDALAKKIDRKGFFGTLYYQDNPNNKIRIREASEFEDAVQQLVKLAQEFRHNLQKNAEYSNVQFYPTDSSGSVNTEAASKLTISGNQPSHLDRNAVLHPGGSIKDIVRGTNIGSKSIINLFAEIIEENPVLREILDIPADIPLVNWVERIRKDEAFSSALNNAVIASGQLGQNPLNDKLLLIKILKTFDEGLKIDCAVLYRAYENLYDQCYSLDSKYVEAVKEIMGAAENLLVAHSRDHLEIVELKEYDESQEDRYYFMRPLIFSGENSGSGKDIKVRFDQRDNKAMIEYLNQYKKVAGGSLSASEDQDIAQIQQYLRSPKNILINDKILLDKFKAIVQSKEDLISCRAEIQDQSFENQSTNCIQNLNKGLEKLKAIGASSEKISEIQSAIEFFGAARNKMLAQYPAQIAVKEELLSVGQSVTNNLFLEELRQAMRVGVETVTSASGAGQSDCAFIFENGQAGYKVTIGRSIFITDEGNLADLRQNSEQDKNALTMFITVKLDADNSVKGEQIPPVKATVTDLVVLSTSDQIDLVETKKAEFTTANTESVSLDSKNK